MPRTENNMQVSTREIINRMLMSVGLIGIGVQGMPAPQDIGLLPRVKPSKYNGNPSKQYGQAHFKQNRRKQLKATAKRKAKKRGQA